MICKNCGEEVSPMVWDPPSEHTPKIYSHTATRYLGCRISNVVIHGGDSDWSLNSAWSELGGKIAEPAEEGIDIEI